MFKLQLPVAVDAILEWDQLGEALQASGVHDLEMELEITPLQNMSAQFWVQLESLPPGCSMEVSLSQDDEYFVVAESFLHVEQTWANRHPLTSLLGMARKDEEGPEEQAYWDFLLDAARALEDSDLQRISALERSLVEEVPEVLIGSLYLDLEELYEDGLVYEATIADAACFNFVNEWLTSKKIGASGTYSSDGGNTIWHQSFLLEIEVPDYELPKIVEVSMAFDSMFGWDLEAGRMFEYATDFCSFNLNMSVRANGISWRFRPKLIASSNYDKVLGLVIMTELEREHNLTKCVGDSLEAFQSTWLSK